MGLEFEGVWHVTCQYYQLQRSVHKKRLPAAAHALRFERVLGRISLTAACELQYLLSDLCPTIRDNGENCASQLLVREPHVASQVALHHK